MRQRLHVGGDRRCAVTCEEAQELHCFGAEPAADLDADHNQATSPRALEFRAQAVRWSPSWSTTALQPRPVCNVVYGCCKIGGGREMS